MRKRESLLILQSVITTFTQKHSVHFKGIFNYSPICEYHIHCSTHAALAFFSFCYNFSINFREQDYIKFMVNPLLSQPESLFFSNILQRKAYLRGEGGYLM